MSNVKGNRVKIIITYNAKKDIPTVEFEPSDALISSSDMRKGIKVILKGRKSILRRHLKNVRKCEDTKPAE